MSSANDKLQNYFGTSQWHSFHSGLVLTDGTKDLAEQFQCWWLMDLVASYQQKLGLEEDELQIWKLEVHPDETATVTCQDGNYKDLARQHIPWTDFSEKEAIVWVENGVLHLPSEH
jgi:hypothetical protein